MGGFIDQLRRALDDAERLARMNAANKHGEFYRGKAAGLSAALAMASDNALPGGDASELHRGRLHDK